MNIWLLVPVKPFVEGKSRLANTLTPAERANLNRNLLTHTLHVIQGAQFQSHTLVISRDSAALSLARQLGAQGVQENGFTLNGALEQGRRRVMGLGADAVLVLPADLPLLTPNDLSLLFQLGRNAPGIVIAPSHDGGTSALLLHPPDAIDFAFGEESFQRHRAAAIAAHVPHQVLRSPTLQYDVDWPQDLRRLHAQNGCAQSIYKQP